MITTATGIPAAPEFDVASAGKEFAPLGAVAFPVVQDRWERLVTMARIGERAERVWAALTEPAHLRNWLGVGDENWAVRGKESTLDFEDGEFFYCRAAKSSPPTAGRAGVLNYLWRWVGVGPAASVTWTLTPDGRGATTVTVVEEATNPPSDWRSWNGMGWPGILDQLANYLRTGRNTRWPWRRMGPYLQIPIPAMPFQAWEALTSPGAIKHWLLRSAGSLAVDDEMTVVMGDASGTALLKVTKSVEAGQEFPSYLPYLEFELRRPSWTQALGGRLWIEPAGLGESLLQVFHHGWERLDIREPVIERKLLTDFWIGAAGRAQMLLAPPPAQAPAMGPHGWSTGAAADGNGAAPSANGHPMQAHLDMSATLGFAEKVIGDLGGATASVLVALGSRVGLLRALAAGPATSAELAERDGLAERYVREWLWGMHSAGYVGFDPATRRFDLPVAHAAVLAEDSSPLCLSGGYELLPAMTAMLGRLAEAFHTGGGVPYEEYPDSLYGGMERMSATWLDGLLVDSWLPAVEGLSGRLARGAKVADVGCGGGRALIKMAQRFPASEFTGFDLNQANVEKAFAAIESAGLEHRVRVRNADATTELSGPLDLVTFFDVLHDAPDPEALLSAARRALTAAGGVALVLEGASADDPEENVGPMTTILYATSVLYCVPTALAEGGPALGTLGLPSGELTSLAHRAGFTSVLPVPASFPHNSLYALRV
jgi:uncharacterized protein YndB with AHSA1/START domain/SAM-dependent methyltransferase